jgi:hypothetical protein
MSGVVSPKRIPRSEYSNVVSRYKDIFLSNIPCIIDTSLSGSVLTNEDKPDFGDIDLLILSNISISDTKQKIIDEIALNYNIQSFEYKNKTKRYYNSGEMITVKFMDYQIDNIICESKEEMNFKREFLSLPCECQGLILGLIKVYESEINNNDGTEWDLSSKSLRLRRDREILIFSQNWDDVNDLLSSYDVDSNSSFSELVQLCKELSLRSRLRIAGLFNRMVSVKSGEVGTEKGNNKIERSKEVNSLCQFQ